MPITRIFQKINCRTKRSQPHKRLMNATTKELEEINVQRVPELPIPLPLKVVNITVQSNAKNVTTEKQRLITLPPPTHAADSTNAGHRNTYKAGYSEYNQETYYDYYDYNYDTHDETKGGEDDCNDFHELMDRTSSISASSQEEIIDDLPSNIYCDLLATLESRCQVNSLLEIWMYHEATISRLTQEDILFAINKLDKSPYFGYAFNYSNLLGAIQRNSSGHIIGARSTLQLFVTMVDLNNLSNLGFASAGSDIDSESQLDDGNYRWQWEVIQTVLQQNSSSIDVNIRMTRSYNDEVSSIIFFDLGRVGYCVAIMFLYTCVMLGRFNLVEQRCYLTAAGLVSVLLAVIISVGLMSALGYAYMPHHSMLSYLFIGLGIDDMFVIMKSWYNHIDNLSDGKQSSLEDNIGMTMKRAGVAITVTSITDVCAFLVGSITVFPGLKAFCISCAIGIAAVYMLQASWFVAWMTLDQRRIEAKGNAMFPCCVKHPGFDLTLNVNILTRIEKRIMNQYIKLLDYPLYNTLMVCVTLGCLSVGLWGVLNIEHGNEEGKLIPTGSYLRHFIENLTNDFPRLGQNVKLFTGAINTKEDLESLDALLYDMEEWKKEKFIIQETDSWWTSFKSYIFASQNISNWKEVYARKEPWSNNRDFSYLMSDFLYSSSGAKYKPNIMFNGTLACNKPAPPIIATSAEVVYQKFDGVEESTRSIERVDKLIKSMNFSTEAFVTGRYYAIWELNDAVRSEFRHNLALAMGVVFAIVLIFLSDLWTTLMVVICVIITLVNVTGFMHFWGHTIDAIICCTIIVTIGLCVDYSAHIGHAFLISTGKWL